MKAGLFAGGASWGAWTVGVHTELRKEYDAYIGTSTGALIALFLALGRLDPVYYDILAYEYSTITNRQMYGWLSPYNRKGKISKVKLGFAFIRMIQADRNYAYDIGKEVRRRILKHFTSDLFHELRTRQIDVIVTVNCVSLKNQPTQYVSILDKAMTFRRFVDCVVASTSIPYFAKPVQWANFSYLDGGILDPTPTALIDKYDNPDIWLMHSLQSEEKSHREVDGWLKLAGSLFDGMRSEIKRGDLQDIKNATLYYSPVFDWAAADFNQKKMKAAIERGRKDAKNNNFTMIKK